MIKSIVYIQVHVLCCTVLWVFTNACMYSRQLYILSLIHCITEQSHCPSNPSVPPVHSFFPHSKLLATTDLFMVSIQFGSVSQLCPTLCDPMDCSAPGLPVHHQLLEFTQTHVHGVGDAIQPSHPLSSRSPPALNLSQHHGLFQ